MVEPTASEHISWFDKLKNSLHVEKLIEKLNLSRYRLLDIGLFLGIGFLIGFVWKRYANYFIAGLLFIAVIFVLHQLEILYVHINWIKIQECCGVVPVVENADIFAMVWNWAKLNIVIIFSFFIGFCFGAKVS